MCSLPVFPAKGVNQAMGRAPLPWMLRGFMTISSAVAAAHYAGAAEGPYSQGLRLRGFSLWWEIRGHQNGCTEHCFAGEKCLQSMLELQESQLARETAWLTHKASATLPLCLLMPYTRPVP